MHVLAAQIGENLCKVLPAVHVLTVYDCFSKIGTQNAALMTKPEHILRTLAPRHMRALLTRMKNTSPRYWRKGRNSRRWISSEMNSTTTVNLCPYSSYRRLARNKTTYPQSSLSHKRDGIPLVHHTWSPGSNTVLVWGGCMTTSLHQRWTPTQYLKRLLSTATVWNVGYRGVHALRMLNQGSAFLWHVHLLILQMSKWLGCRMYTCLR